MMSIATVMANSKPYPFFVETSYICERLHQEIEDLWTKGIFDSRLPNPPHFQFSRWLTKNVDGKWYDGNKRHRYGMYFELEIDAMAFKLRWC